VCFVHTRTNNLIPGTETEASLQKYPELRRLVKFLRANNLKIGQCKKQLRLLKDQTLPQADVSVDVSTYPSSKLADLMDRLTKTLAAKSSQRIHGRAGTATMKSKRLEEFVKLFIAELESRKNLSPRLKRLHDTMKK
jgi:hypothetical protein